MPSPSSGSALLKSARLAGRPVELLGAIGTLSFQSVLDVFRPPMEFQYFLTQFEEIGWRSLPLILASGFAVGVVMTLHTRSTLVQFGAEALIPTFQAVAFFSELGPLLTGLLVAGRVGAGIGAELANMRATEQIDAIESLSVDSFKFLVVTRVAACTFALPALTLFTDFAGIVGGYVSERSASHLSLQLYLDRAFADVTVGGFLLPTAKTAVFGFIIGSVSSYFGYTTNEGSDGVRRAATNSVVLSSLLLILVDVLLVKAIFFFFPGDTL